MYVVGKHEMNEMDRYTMEHFGLPGVVLMENAGSAVVAAMMNELDCSSAHVVVLAGGGNNGGDGFVIARKLYDAGISVMLGLLVDPATLKGDALCHFNVYRNRQLPLLLAHHSSTFHFLQEVLQSATVIVDAMLGTGASGPLRKPYDAAIPLVNEMRKNRLVVSVDLPSGVDCDTGIVETTAVQAHYTYTFVYPKKGFFIGQGPKYVGQWDALPISVPPSLVEELSFHPPKLLTREFIQERLPERPVFGHKGTFGHALVIGGSCPYAGAPLFTTKAAAASGAGLVTLAVPCGLYGTATHHVPEALQLPLPENEGYFALESVEVLLPKLTTFSSIAIGPGLGRFSEGEQWLNRLLLGLDDQPIVIDADGLYHLRHQLDLISELKGPVLLTPHPGEMAMLMNTSIETVEQDRLFVAREFATQIGAYVLLKGHRSIVATPDGELYINPYGHDALGKGGSGDVLTGIVVAFLAQQFPPTVALTSATVLHALAGEQQAKIRSHYGVIPQHLIEGITEMLRSFETH